MKKIIIAIVSIFVLFGSTTKMNAADEILPENGPRTPSTYDLPRITDYDVYSQIYTEIEKKYNGKAKIISYSPQILDNSGVIRTSSISQTYISETTDWVDVGYAKNQYQHGVTFQGSGGAIYYSDSTGSDVNIDFSINGGWYSVGIGLGWKNNGVAAYSLNCSAYQACKLFVEKYVNVQLYHVVYSYEGQIQSENDVPVKFELQLRLSNRPE